MRCIKTILLFLFCSVSLSGQGNDWVLKKNKNDIKVYYRDSETSRVKELRMTFDVKSSLSTLVAVLNDVEAFDDWVYKLDITKMVRRVSPTEIYYYNEMNFPWPLDNRDFIVRSTIEQNPKTKVVVSHGVSAHNYLDEKDDIVRIKILDIKWFFYPKADGTITVDYFLKSDPGGNLPAWLINLALDQGPMETIIKFRKILKKEKYKNEKFDYIKEF